MAARLAIHARATRQALIVAALAMASAPVAAAPRGAEAKAAFDRGISAYQKQNYAAAAEALAKSYNLEVDIETLFAWAQAERQQDHCDKAIELYNKLLALALPAENASAVRAKLEECKAIIAARPPVEPPAPKTKPIAPDDKPAPSEPLPSAAPGEVRPWWRDPIGATLFTSGLIGLGVGAYFLASARTANEDAKTAPTYADFEQLSDRASSRGKIGVVAMSAGGALLIGGFVWSITRRPQTRSVTAWAAPDGGGILAFGRF